MGEWSNFRHGEVEPHRVMSPAELVLTQLEALLEWVERQVAIRPRSWGFERRSLPWPGLMYPRRGQMIDFFADG